MNKKVLKTTSLSALAVLLGAVAANAAVPVNTVIVGDKAYSIDYLMDSKNTDEISAQVAKGGNIYYKFTGETTWTNVFDTNTKVSDADLAKTIPTVTYFATTGAAGTSVTVSEVATLAIESVKAVTPADVKTALPSTSVSANSDLEIKFNKAVDKATVTTGTITLTQDGIKQLVAVSYDADTNTATVELSPDGTVFSSGKDYTLTVNGVKDASGASISNATYKFTTSVNPIVTTAQYDLNNVQTDVDGAVVDDNNDTVTVRFNKDMDVSTFTYSNIKMYDVTDSKYVATVINPNTMTKAGFDVTIDGTYEATHQYRVILKGDIADIAGNKLGSDYTTNFFFGLAAPSVDLTSVKAAEQAGDNTGRVTNVYPKLTASAGNAAFTWKAQLSAGDDTVDKTTVNTKTVVLQESETEAEVPATVTYEEGSMYIIVTPKADLKENTEYTVVIDGVKTSKGLEVAKVEPTFSTGDFTSPVIEKTTPANADDSVALDSNLVVNFSEKMLESTMTPGTNIHLYNLTDDSAMANDLLSSSWLATLDETGKVLTLKAPTGTKLNPDKTYRLKLDKVVKTNGNITHGVADASGRNGLVADYKINFNSVKSAATTLVDVHFESAYSSTGTAKASGSLKIDSTKNMYITFDQALKAENLGTYDLEDYVTVEHINQSTGLYVKDTVGAGTVTLTNSNKTIALDTSLIDPDTQYRITLSDSIKDSYENSIAKTVYTFTTGTKPAVDTAVSYPSNFAVGIDTEVPYITVLLDDANSALKASTLTASNVKVVKKSDASAAPFDLKYVNSAKPGTETITADLTQNSADITLAGAQKANVKVGNIITIAGESKAYVVIAKVNDVATLDRNIDINTASGVAVTRHQGVVFALQDDAELASDTEYEVRSTGVTDAVGNPIDDTTYTFRTAEVIAQLKYVDSSVKDGSTGIKVDTPVVLNFNTDVDGDSVTTNTLKIYEVSNNGTENEVTANFDVDVDGTAVTVTPQGFWKKDTRYKVFVDHTVSSDATNVASKGLGTTTTYDKTVSFRTEQTASVSPKILSAVYYDVDGSSTVNANDVIRVTFNSVVDAATFVAANGNADFAVSGLNSSLQTSTVSYTATKKYVDITLSANTGIVPGIATIKVAGTSGNTALQDGVGNYFTTDSVTITK